MPKALPVPHPALALSLAIAIAGSLAGCAPVYHDEVFGSYSTSALTTAGAASGIPIQVDGKVGDAAVHYAPCAAYTECTGDHVVWTFGPPAARPASAYPSALATNIDWIGPYTPAPDNVAVKVAVIQHGTIVATAAGQVDADNPDSAAFQDLIASMARRVMPADGWLDPYLPF